MITKYNSLVERLMNKIDRSQIPVPGFIMGLSGSDSILAFLLLYEACDRKNLGDRVLGIHYISENHRKLTWFEEHIIPWLDARCPKATIIIQTPLGGNQDQQRWADLHLRALNEFRYGSKGMEIRPRETGDNYWVAGAMNATEKLLGKYSILANSVSIQPIQTVLKSQVLVMCEELGVPEIAIRYARIPDCLCGRDELAANNIELIDKILTFDPDVMNYDQKLVATMYQYIRDLKKTNDFKMRIPYVV